VDQRRPGHVTNAQELREKLDRLLERLNSVLSAMEEGADYAKILDQILAIEREQRQRSQELHRYHERLVWELFNQLEGGKKD